MKRILIVITAMLSVLIATQAQAKSTEYKVINVSYGDRLNMRKGPSVHYSVLSSLPSNAKGIRVILWAKHKTGKHYWAKIAWNDRFGWVNSYYLNASKKSSPVKRILYRCVGTEPFWDINIYKRRVKVHTLNGVKFTAPIVYSGRPMNAPTGTTITNAVSARRSVVVMTEKKYCSDGMSSEDYAYKAIVLINGREALSGCCN